MADFLKRLTELTDACRQKILTVLKRDGSPKQAVHDPLSDIRYVVVDLEWNQYPKWVRTPISREGIVMPHEIIQIGAVKVDGAFRIIDTFVIYIRLQGRRKLSKHVAKVIQKTQEEIDSGVDFPVAYARFSDWSADAERFITWGGDDLRVFQNNLEYYKMSGLEPNEWYDAQLIYAKQVRGDRVQTALAKAAEVLGVEDNLLHHDALNDAYITVGVCSQLNMAVGMVESQKQRVRPSPKRDDNRLFMQKKFVSASSEGNFESRALAKQHCSAMPVACPICGSVMKMEPKRVSSGDRWMRMAVCKEHGKHLVRYRVRRKGDGEYVWTRTTYAPDTELERYYREKLVVSNNRHHRAPKPAQVTQRQKASAEG